MSTGRATGDAQCGVRCVLERDTEFVGCATLATDHGHGPSLRSLVDISHEIVSYFARRICAEPDQPRLSGREAKRGAVTTRHGERRRAEVERCRHQDAWFCVLARYPRCPTTTPGKPGVNAGKAPTGGEHLPVPPAPGPPHRQTHQGEHDPEHRTGGPPVAHGGTEPSDGRRGSRNRNTIQYPRHSLPPSSRGTMR